MYGATGTIILTQRLLGLLIATIGIDSKDRVRKSYHRSLQNA
jgi:hypothetical protein